MSLPGLTHTAAKVFWPDFTGRSYFEFPQTEPAPCISPEEFEAMRLNAIAMAEEMMRPKFFERERKPAKTGTAKYRRATRKQRKAVLR